MVYFLSVDYVLGREHCTRVAWGSHCHLPKVMFTGKKARKGSAASKLKNYPCFKRMLAIKPAVFSRHKEMLRLYEGYCHEAARHPYWDNDDDGDVTGEGMTVVPADNINEADCDGGF